MIHAERTSPAEFLTAFMSATETLNEDLCACWGEYKKYTQVMREKVFQQTADRLLLTAYLGDYYTLDAIFFRERDTEHFSVERTYAKQIEVAIEHENSIAGSAIEMNKLQLLNVPLKVLITYGYEAQRVKYLETYRKIIGWADVFRDVGTMRRQLVVFGGEEPSEKIVWHAYAYEKDDWTHLP